MAVAHAATLCGAAQRVERRAEPVDELREAAREVDRAALDVVEREHAFVEPV